MSYHNDKGIKKWGTVAEMVNKIVGMTDAEREMQISNDLVIPEGASLEDLCAYFHNEKDQLMISQ